MATTCIHLAVICPCNHVSSCIFLMNVFDIVSAGTLWERMPECLLLVSQDPSYDPYGFAKVATRAASSEGGSADACPSNVQDFFQTIFSLANTSDGLNQINTDMHLCSDSMVSSYDQVNQTLAQYIQMQWVSAVTHDSLLDIAVIDMLNSSTIGKTSSASICAGDSASN